VRLQSNTDIPCYISSSAFGEFLKSRLQNYLPSIDITNLPELVRIAEEVEATNQPRVLKSDNTPIALLTPGEKETLKPSKTASDCRNPGACRIME